MDLHFKFVPPGQRGPDQPDDPPGRCEANNFLEDQLKRSKKGCECVLARIYGFSYEGHYYDLAKPAIFLVHGPGADPEAPPAVDPRVTRAPADVDRTGVAAQGYSFSDDMRVWSYDKGDYSVRLDPETGPFEDILLEMELRAGMQGTHFSGAEARIRTSGAEARIRTSGAEARSRNRGGSWGD